MHAQLYSIVAAELQQVHVLTIVWHLCHIVPPQDFAGNADNFLQTVYETAVAKSVERVTEVEFHSHGG